MRPDLRYRYWRDAEGTRVYLAEKDPDRAETVAVELDRMIAEGAPAADVFALLRRNDDISPAVFARMLRFARMFHVDFWDRSGRGDPDYLFSRLRELPADVQYAANHGGRMQVHRFLRCLEQTLRRKPASAEGLRIVFEKCPFLVSRIYQDDVFLRVDDDYREVMLDNLRDIPFGIRLAFVTQVVTSRTIPREWRLRCFAKGCMRCWRECYVRIGNRLPRTRVSLLGSPLAVGMPIPGLNMPYYPEHVTQMEPYHDDSRRYGGYDQSVYMLSVNRRVQNVFAEHPFVRELYASTSWPGHEAASTRLLDRVDEWNQEEWEEGPPSDPGIEAFDEDLPSKCLIMFDLMGGEFSPRLLSHLARGRQKENLAALVRERPALVESVLPLERLPFLLSSAGDWELAEKVVRAVEKQRPGTVARTSDAFGNTPLTYMWFASSNRFYWWDPGERQVWAPGDIVADRRAWGRYEACLLELGCDPRRRNHLGLSAEDLWKLAADVGMSVPRATAWPFADA